MSTHAMAAAALVRKHQLPLYTTAYRLNIQWRARRPGCCRSSPQAPAGGSASGAAHRPPPASLLLRLWCRRWACCDAVCPASPRPRTRSERRPLGAATLRLHAHSLLRHLPAASNRCMCH